MRTIPLLLLIVLLSGTAFVSAQTKQSVGSVTVSGNNVKIPGTKKSALPRKRFYLFRGGLKDNEALVARIKAAEITSRDCFYTQLKASACFINWLQKENCESPFCRKVDQDDIGIKEFEDAYNKGLVLYKKRPDLALSWIIDSLPSELMNGFYRSRKAKIEEILGGQKPLLDTMTSGSAVEAKFVDVPIGVEPMKFLVSNVIPLEIGTKSYVWICEVSVPGKNTPVPVPLSLDPKSKCPPIPRDLQVCNTGTCDKK